MFTAAAAKFKAEFPPLPVPKPPQQQKLPKNAWFDISSAKTSPLAVAAPPHLIDNNATQATSTSTFTNSSKLQTDFKALRKNIRNVALCHKQLETVVMEQYLDKQDYHLDLLKTFDQFCLRMVCLEQARQCQAAINQVHLQFSMDPCASFQNGTTEKLLELVLQDRQSALDDKAHIEQDRYDPMATADSAILRSNILRNCEHYQSLLQSQSIPDGEPFSLIDLTELEVQADSASDDMSRLTEFDNSTINTGLELPTFPPLPETPQDASNMDVTMAEYTSLESTLTSMVDALPIHDTSSGEPHSEGNSLLSHHLQSGIGHLAQPSSLSASHVPLDLSLEITTNNSDRCTDLTEDLPPSILGPSSPKSRRFLRKTNVQTSRQLWITQKNQRSPTKERDTKAPRHGSPTKPTNPNFSWDDEDDDKAEDSPIPLPDCINPQPTGQTFPTQSAQNPNPPYPPIPPSSQYNSMARKGSDDT